MVDILRDSSLAETVKQLSDLEQVESIAVAGSFSRQATDKYSDIDIYVYLDNDIEPEIRMNIYNSCNFKDLELNMQFWDSCDAGCTTSGTKFEIIFWNKEWIKEEVDSVMIDHNAKTGYTTAFVYTIVNSIVIYDMKHWFEDMQKKCNNSYPEELVNNILKKNYPLLKDQSCSYYNQIKSAVYRNDIISINHRLSEFMASYFDIIFAANQKLHPGEKRLIDSTISTCKMLPDSFKPDIFRLFSSIYSNDSNILVSIDVIVKNLDVFLKAADLMKKIEQ